MELHSYTNPDERAEELAPGPPPAVPDLTRAEIEHCLEIIEKGEEPRGSFCRGLLANSFPSSGVPDLLTDPKRSATIAEMADEILRRAGTGDPILL